jgi:hypothetical protein
MANLSQFLGGGSGSEGDPRAEGAPLYCMYGGDYNSGGFNSIIRDTTANQAVGSPWGAVTNSTASYSFGQVSNGQGFGYNGDAGTPSNNFSSQTSTSYAAFSQSLFQNDQYPHFMYGTCSKEGAIAWNSSHAQMGHTSNNHLINHTGMPAGVRPRRYYTIYNNTFSWRRNAHVQSANAQHHIVDKIDLAAVTGVSRQNSYSTSYGMGSYNEKTKTLVTIHGAGATTFDVTLYTGTKNLNKVARLSDYFDNCTVKNFSVTGSAPTNLSTMNYANCMFVDDNDRLTISWSYSNNHYLYNADLSGSEGTVAGVQTANIGNTTSYGPEQGLQYRPRIQTTWDGKWVAMYRPYYYYGCGHSVYFVSTEDSNRYFKANYTSSDGGGAFFPSGRTGFSYYWGGNSDSSGPQNSAWDFTATSTTGTANTFYGFNTNISGAALTGIANGASLNTSLGYVNTGYYYSTNYPRYCTVNWWPKDNNSGGDFFATEYTGA